MVADTVRLPAASTATALTCSAPLGSTPVVHHAEPEQAVPEHGSVAKFTPPPQSSMAFSATLSLALAPTWMLLPVHTLSPGCVTVTVGGVVSPVPLVVPVLVVVLDTFTVRVAEPVAPAE